MLYRCIAFLVLKVSWSCYQVCVARDSKMAKDDSSPRWFVLRFFGDKRGKMLFHTVNIPCLIAWIYFSLRIRKNFFLMFIDRLFHFRQRESLGAD